VTRTVPAPKGGDLLKTVEIRISGKVQNVGFRSCIRRIAGKLNIKGQVMNLSDGSVQVVASGDPIILEKFISMIYGCPRAVIRDMSITEQEYRIFEVFCVIRPGL
jgi:acylphosphatase